MSETYLNGKITVTSLAAPTDEDMRKISALSSEERKQLLDEALERGRKSGLSKRSKEDIAKSAKAKAAARSTTSDHAL